MVTLFIKLCILCSVILSTSDAFLRSKNSINSFRQTSIYSGNLVEQFDLTTLTKFMKRALVAPLIFTLGQLPILSMPGHAEENIPTRVLSSSTEETTNSKHVEVYFGVGCFWHVQHELVGAERKILSRGDDQLTGLTGYAGGSRVGKDGTVCYHNTLRKSEYGDMGHSEVVNLKLPIASVPSFAKEYFHLFRNGDRPDRGDRGAEYRSLIGVPGGIKSELVKEMQPFAEKAGVRLVEGRGNDPDTLDKKLVYVMDTAKFPFYVAEVYHQFHDGFMPDEQYPQKYNDIKKLAVERGLIKPTGCPENFF